MRVALQLLAILCSVLTILAVLNIVAWAWVVQGSLLLIVGGLIYAIDREMQQIEEEG